MVSYDGTGPVTFLPKNPAGRFKGKDPTVSLKALLANWAVRAEVLYIGKADELGRRLMQFAGFGAGKTVGHWGGRLIWQLADADQLIVAWKETPGRVPRQVEAELIRLFRQQYGKPPFANDPHRLEA